MDISQKLVTQEKEVFLKKINSFKILLLYIFLIINSNTCFANNLNDSDLIKALSYIYNTKEFSSQFIQTENNSLSEGFLYLKDDRIKIEYTSPSKIQIILAKNKAMYFNKDLEEVEYFRPGKTTAKIFYDIFYDEKFFLDSKILKENNFLKIQKIIFIDKVKTNISLIFETNPIVIKKINIANEDGIIDFNILNPNFNPALGKKFFSMINPLTTK